VPAVDVDYYVKKRAWTYIRKIVGQQEDSLPKKFLRAWLQCPRKQGHPQKSSKSLYVAMFHLSFRPNQPFFQLAKDKNIREQKMEDCTNKLKEQMKNQASKNSDQNNNNELGKNEEE